MLTKVSTVSIKGLEVTPVTVEVNISERGLPRFDIVGLGDKSVNESKYRIKTAFQNSGISFPNKKITVNLAPAYISKEGSCFDLPIAVGILCAVKGLVVPFSSMFFGELSLDGTVKKTTGIFLFALTAKENGTKSIFIPFESAQEASWVEGVTKYGVRSLNSLAGHVDGRFKLTPLEKQSQNKFTTSGDDSVSFDDIIGQEFAKRALTICAAGGHNILLFGTPGAGKSLLAHALQGVLPPLTDCETSEVLKIRSAAGWDCSENINSLYERPFRSPHHSASFVGMLGGGTDMTIGEISLAHRGVLFMDEFNLFRKDVLESLRIPLEEGVVKLTRSKGTVTFPAKFTLVAACNPCPCGYYMSDTTKCTCSSFQIANYLRRLSGPILDRIDMHINVQSVSLSDIMGVRRKERTAQNQIKQQVLDARKIQAERLKDLSISTNAEMNSADVEKCVELSSDSRKVLNTAAEKYKFSTRTYFKIIKLARTIADLEASISLSDEHIYEALQYRTRLQY